jgi:hypothetical protein
MTSKRKEYTTPRLIVHGDVEVITQGNQNGYALDASFPIHTPKKNLTFS